MANAAFDRTYIFISNLKNLIINIRLNLYFLFIIIFAFLIFFILIPDFSPRSTGFNDIGYKKGLLDIKDISYLGTEIGIFINNLLTSPHTSSQHLYKVFDGKMLKNNGNKNEKDSDYITDNLNERNPFYEILKSHEHGQTDNIHNGPFYDFRSPSGISFGSGPGSGIGSGSAFSRPGSQIKPGEQMQTWLVPVRTARNVLGVLRVNVLVPKQKVPHTPTHTYTDTHTDTMTATKLSPSKVSFSPDVTPYRPSNTHYHSRSNSPNRSNSQGLGNLNDSISDNDWNERINAAQNNIINFSEIFAPLLFSAININKLKNNATVNSEKKIGGENAQKSGVNDMIYNRNNDDNYTDNNDKNISISAMNQNIEEKGKSNFDSSCWRSVCESAIVLLSSAAGHGPFTYEQAVQLTKQFMYVLEQEYENENKLIGNNEKILGTENEKLEEVSFRNIPRNILKPMLLRTTEKSFKNNEYQDRKMNNSSQLSAILALKSILNNSLNLQDLVNKNTIKKVIFLCFYN